LKDDAKAEQLGWKTRVRILTGIATVLNYMHRSSEQPVYHRDVKSSNIVLSDGFIPKLIHNNNCVKRQG
jgi:serine/threonine protein kinase